MTIEALSARRQSLSLILRRSAARHGERCALRFGNDAWSYAELDDLVDRLATGFLSRGIALGDRVAILARNSHAFVAVRFALARIGVVFVPINFMLSTDEVAYVLQHSGARILLVDTSTVGVGLAARTKDVEAVFGLPDEQGACPNVEGVPEWSSIAEPGRAQDVANADDLLQIIYTSGTEARPKGAMLTHGAVLWEYQSCIIDCEWTSDTVALHALPLFHCAQLDCMMGPGLQIGAENVITATPSAEKLIPMLAGLRVTSFFAPPTVWIALLRSALFDEHDLSSLQKAYYGASLMPVEILREIQARIPGLRLWNLYGQTEIAPVATILFPDEHDARCGSAGRPTLHVETRVVDEAMRDVATGEIGEIVHRSPQLMTGYWNDEERTRSAFQGGWFHSGDLGVFDAQGYLTIVDRMKDMIKSGGENVSSREVEEILYTHPTVMEAAVVGVPDPRWIEAVVAIIVLREGASATASDLIAHCGSKLAKFKTPKHVIFVDGLPRNASGKILKRELREVADSGYRLRQGREMSPGSPQPAR